MQPRTPIKMHATNCTAGAQVSSTFGYPGEGGYREYWRMPDGSLLDDQQWWLDGLLAV